MFWLKVPIQTRFEARTIQSGISGPTTPPGILESSSSILVSIYLERMRMNQDVHDHEPCLTPISRVCLSNVEVFTLVRQTCDYVVFSND